MAQSQKGQQSFRKLFRLSSAEFVERTRQVGFVEATDENHYSVDDYARLVMAGRSLGKSDGDIATAVNTVAA